jgi:hypothetical protein
MRPQGGMLEREHNRNITSSQNSSEQPLANINKQLKKGLHLYRQVAHYHQHIVVQGSPCSSPRSKLASPGNDHVGVVLRRTSHIGVHILPRNLGTLGNGQRGLVACTSSKGYHSAVLLGRQWWYGQIKVAPPSNSPQACVSVALTPWDIPACLP